VQAAEAADTLKELGGEGTAREATGLHKLENQAALLIAFLAMCLAITAVAGGDNEQLILQSEMKAADTFAFYQAKTIRRTSTILAKDDLELRQLAEGGAWSPEAQRAVQEKIAFYEQEIDRYRNEPDEGTQDLLTRARELEAARDLGVRKDPNFDYAEGLFQIAIVVASVAILTKLRPLQITAAGVGLLALILMLNGFALFFELPF
jgi:hypothetical protein